MQAEGGPGLGRIAQRGFLRQAHPQVVIHGKEEAVIQWPHLTAVDLVEESTELVDRLWSNTRFFQAEMKKLGFDTGVTQTPITPVMLGDVQLAREFSRRLYDDGLFAMALGFPTVPIGKARIRVIISAAHSQQDLEEALDIFDRVGKSLGVR